MTDPRPVLYLDLDDTIVSWAAGHPRPGPGAREFLLWALERTEVRWLTSWAPSGRMEEGLLQDLASLTGIEIERLRPIRGLDWRGCPSKLDGIAWLEHVVLGRPFVWVEDSTVPAGCLDFLCRYGFRDRYRLCDVTRDPEALRGLHEALVRELG